MRMKVKPKDRPKFIGLMAAIGLLAGYIIFVVIPNLPHTTVGPVAPANSAPPVSVTPVSLSAGVAHTASLVPDANRAALSLIETEAPRDVKRDPFVSPAPSSVSAPSVPAAPTPTPPLAKPGVATPPAPPKATVPNASPASSASQTDEKFTLLGIASAEDSVAIFQLGSDIVEKKPGDHLPGNMRVEAVEEEAVRLSRGKQRFRMEVGQAPVAVEPASRGQEPHTPAQRIAVSRTGR